MVLKSTEGLRAGILVFELNGTGSEQATSRKGITRMLLGYEGILKMSRQTSVFDLKSSSGTLALPFVLLDSSDNADDPPTVQSEVPPP